LNGFADSFAQGDGLTVEALAVTARVDGEGIVLSLSGSLDLTTNLITLTQLASAGTANNATYVQTTVDKLVFKNS